MPKPSKTRIDAVSAANSEALAICHRIRRAVFCVEQGVPANLEWDDLDHQCRHYLLYLGDTPAATARSRAYGDSAIKIERVATLKEHRGQGLGRVLMERIIADARHAGAIEAVLNAQIAVHDFYAGLGFVAEGDEFMDADIPHIHMRLKLR